MVAGTNFLVLRALCDYVETLGIRRRCGGMGGGKVRKERVDEQFGQSRDFLTSNVWLGLC